MAMRGMLRNLGAKGAATARASGAASLQRSTTSSDWPCSTPSKRKKSAGSGRPTARTG